MTRGKEICNQLKAVRRSIAEENGIALEMPDCPHQGPCAGTCPRCEAELRSLERALTERIRRGKAATVAGIALALASPAVAQSETKASDKSVKSGQVAPQAKLYPVFGTIVDAKTKEPLPFCNVVATRFEDKATLSKPQMATTDFDGVFRMDLPEGNYRLNVKYVGYKPVELPLKVSAKNDTIDVAMEITGALLGEPEVIICGLFDEENHIIEMGPENATNTEMEGVPLRIQY